MHNSTSRVSQNHSRGFLRFSLPSDWHGAAGVSWSIVSAVPLTSEGTGAENTEGLQSETSGRVGSGGEAADESEGTHSGSDTITVCWALISSRETSMVDHEKDKDGEKERRCREVGSVETQMRLSRESENQWVREKVHFKLNLCLQTAYYLEVDTNPGQVSWDKRRHQRDKKDQQNVSTLIFLLTTVQLLLDSGFVT